MLRDLIASLCLVVALSAAAPADCPLDHFIITVSDGRLGADASGLYQDGDPVERYYPLTWSFLGWWSTGVPGFTMTDDPLLQPAGTPNVDYQLWFEIVDLSPSFRIYMERDGVYLTQVGERYNLSTYTDHHAHMKYRTLDVPSAPAPDYPFWVTYRLVDDFGTYAPSVPFVVVFNVPAPAVAATDPPDAGELASCTAAQISLTFHRPIALLPGVPVTLTDAATGTQDYYTGLFTHAVAPDGLTLVLTQVTGTLPADTQLRLALTANIVDATNGRPAIPYTLHVWTPATTTCPGDANCDGVISWRDIDYFVAAMNDNHAAWQSMFAPAAPACAFANNDVNADGTVSWRDIDPLVAVMNTACP